MLSKSKSNKALRILGLGALSLLGCGMFCGVLLERIWQRSSYTSHTITSYVGYGGNGLDRVWVYKVQGNIAQTEHFVSFDCMDDQNYPNIVSINKKRVKFYLEGEVEELRVEKNKINPDLFVLEVCHP
jgi:hypothetical protein